MSETKGEMSAMNLVNKIWCDAKISHKNASVRALHTTITIREAGGALTDIPPIGMAYMAQGAHHSAGTGRVQFRDSQILPESNLIQVSNCITWRHETFKHTS